MKLIYEQNAFLLDVCKLRSFIYNSEPEIFVTGGELLRTPEQQKIYFDTGRSKTMDSNHLKKLAIDLNFIKDGKLISDKKALQKFGDFWEILNPLNRAGMNFKSIYDPGHFERNLP
jgi:hypothetical protein